MGVIKRAMDIVVGTLLALACLPIMIATALVAAAALRCWPLFVQHRVGRDGRLFRMVKIRTLPKTAPRYASKYELTEVKIPAATALLRRLHLDELPQLLLVPFGRMSLVGPRPEMQALNGEFDDASAELRISVRPGCTGLWQVSPRADALIAEAPEFDRFYIDNQNLRLDLWILWRTLCLMGFGRKTVSLDQIPQWAIRRPAVPAEASRRARVEDAPTPVLESAQ